MELIMSKKYMMRHCTLEKRIKETTAHTTAWLPEKYAEIGRFVRLKQSNNSWVDGWEVKSVSVHSKRSDEVAERSQDYKRTREASDI
jgi:hypothetical protein